MITYSCNIVEIKDCMMKFFNTRNWGALLGVFLLTLMPANAAMTFPNINIGLGNANTPQDFTNGLQILIWLTILTLAPSILIMTTSFIRLVVVLSLTRLAISQAFFFFPPSRQC